MPARKSAQSMQSDEGPNTARDGMSVEDLNLPKSMVQRLAKGVLPPNTQIQRDALLAISKSATVFVNYISSHANENAQRSSKKTIQPHDVFEALKETEFEAFIPRLQAELAKYNAIQCDKRNSYRRKVKEEKAAAAAKAAESILAGADPADAAPAGANGQTKPPAGVRDEDAPPAAKKARRSESDEADEDEDEPDAADDDQEDEEGEDGSESEGEEEEGDDDDDDGDDEVEAGDQLVEDPLEIKEGVDIEDEALDGDESD